LWAPNVPNKKLIIVASYIAVHEFIRFKEILSCLDVSTIGQSVYITNARLQGIGMHGYNITNSFLFFA
jgi:hypothetical protein